jgi:hypothetical protein
MEVDGWSTLNIAETVDKALANGFRVAFSHLQLVELKVDQWRWWLARKLAFSCTQTHNLVLTSLETRLQLRFGSLLVLNASCHRMYAGTFSTDLPTANVINSVLPSKIFGALESVSAAES